MAGETHNARDLYFKDLPKPRWAIPGLLPEGVHFLAGAPKIGKSMMALDLCLAVASGSPAFGQFDTVQGDVLYLALEGSEWRLQERMQRLTPEEPPSCFDYATSWRRFGQGGIPDLGEWLTNHPKARLVVIDPFARVKSKIVQAGNAYDKDYQSSEGLLNLAHEHHVPIILVHHKRKMPAEDPLDEISGSIGLSGSADGIFILKRPRNKNIGTLFVTGRDVETQELKVKWNGETFKWTADSSGPAEVMSPQRKTVYWLLMISGSMTPKEVAEKLGKEHNNTKQLLWKMAKDGQIETVGDGRYAAYVKE